MCHFGLVLFSFVVGSSCGSLVNDFSVKSYILNLTVVDSSSPVDVSIDIELVCISPTSYISLDWGSSLDSPYKDNFKVVRQGSSSSPMEVYVGQIVDLVSSQDAITIVTTPTSSGSTFSVGDKVTVTVRTRTAINKEQKGLFSRQYSYGGSTWTLLATSLFPSYARELFPCIDEPSMTASIKLTLVTPFSWAVATSLRLDTSEIDETTKMSTKTFLSRSSVPVYSFAMFISDNMRSVIYNKVQRTNITFWVPDYLTATNVDSCLDFLSGYFYKIENILDLNYPLPNSLNIVLVPDLAQPFAGQGVIFIRYTKYSSYYYTPQLEGLFREIMLPVTYQFLRQFTEFTARPASWADFWLHSAINTYLQYTILNAIEPPFDFRTDLEVIVRQTALGLDDGAHSMPLIDDSIDGASPSTVETALMDPLKKLKGASLFSMLDLSFPAGCIFSTIKTLLQNYKEASVSSEQFFDQFTATVINSGGYISRDTTQALANVQAWFNSSGYPLINITADPTSPVTLEMSSFCQLQICKDSLPSWWSAHVSLGTKSDPRFYSPRQDIWVNSTQKTFVELTIKKGDWLAANMQSGGFYRTQYPVINWERLTSKDIQPEGRSQLLDDAFALSEAGLLDYNVTLHLAMSNIKAVPYRDWYPIYNGLTRLQDYLRCTDLYPTFQDFFIPLLQLVNSQVEEGMFSNVYDREKVSSLFFGERCNYNIGNVRSTAKSNIAILLEGYPPLNVARSSYNALVCCGAEYGASLDADAMWKIVLDPSASHLKRHFNAIALGCLSNNTSVGQLKMYLNSGKVENRNAYLMTMAKFLAEKQPSTLLTLISETPESFQRQFGVPVLASLVSTAGHKLNYTQNDLMKRVTLVGVDDLVKHAASAYLDVIATRLNWLNSHKSSILLALQSNKVANITNSTSSSLSQISSSNILLLVSCFVKIIIFHT